MTRTFSRPAEGLERDEDGHRVGFKLYVRQRRPMSASGWRRWGLKQRGAIAKSRYVWCYYASSRAMNYPDGIPVAMMKDDKTLADFLIENFLLEQGFTYSIHGYTNGRTKTMVKQTKSLMKLEVLDAENLKYNVSGTGRLSRYWFRRETKKKPQRTGDFG